MNHSQRKDQRLHCIDAKGMEHSPRDSFVLRLSRGPSFSTHTADSPDAYDAAPTSAIAASGSPNCPRRRASADPVRHLNNKNAASPLRKFCAEGSGVLFDRDT
jgi:hypothetical protein